ncbi:pectinesterase family protein [Phytomonospora sp. NPDC050363]|uniref:pectinesterase family protein n=1 Tax=Phytomonospora sp. NPDC050363 TaxID=3155642 RepID=UPI0033ED0DAD
MRPSTPFLRGRLGLAASAGLLPLFAMAPIATASAASPDSAVAATITVAADGSGDFRTVQQAIDAVPGGTATTIRIKPGTYRGAITVPSTKSDVRMEGLGAEPSAVTIVENHSAGTLKPDGTTYGTSGSATATVNGRGFVATNLTIANDFDEAAHAGEPGHQAVALNISSDRSQLLNVRLLGNQDTFYVKDAARVYVKGAHIEGDVDFIFGGGIAVFHNTRVHTTRRSGSSITAASTPAERPYGFLFFQCQISGDAPAASTTLGRPWRPDGSVVVRNSVLGAHIRAAQPWTDMSGNPWTGARFFEYRNTGAGAGSNGNRPQLTNAQALDHTVQRYLAGADGWNPAAP